tara:strand:- start:5 stop:1003 length:999 start_codon:yes stop_codon:yes gene_type:complete
MSNYTDLKYISRVSSRLEQFKQKSDALFNFRCPHCGDSKKSKTKARAYLYRVKGDMFFKCHNCGMGQNLLNFIKFLDPKIYEEYLLDRYKSSRPATPKPDFDFKPKKFLNTSILDTIKKVSDLDVNHPARLYCVKREIPEKHLDKLYFCDKFTEFVNKVKKNTFTTAQEHPRLIIPFFNTEGKVFAFQGRAFGNENPKYLTIKIDEDEKKVYGLDRVNFQEHIYITEGPIDSLFIDNCIAAGGSDLLFTRVPPEQVTYIFDNEPRNLEIVKRMEKVIEKDYNIVVWSENIKEKDINEMIIKGLSSNELHEIIKQNTYSKLSALTKLSYWRKR